MEKPKNITNEQWRTALAIYNSAKKQGDKFPELTVAQAALESGWFKYKSGKNNFFGQKASKSQKGTSVTTTEVANNKEYKTKQKFRDYDTIDEAVTDRIKKWSSKYNDATSVEEAIGKIWRYDKNKGTGVGYATDTKYGEKVKSVLGTLGTSLKDYDYTIDSETQDIRAYITDVDFDTPQQSGIVFTEEEKTPQQEAKQASQELMEDSFKEELEQLQQSQIQQQQEYAQQQAPPIQYDVELNPIEYQPIQQYQDGGEIIKDDNGYWNPANWGKVVEINSPIISMEGVNQNLIGVSKETGERKLMTPNNRYFFKDTKSVIEFPSNEK